MSLTEDTPPQPPQRERYLTALLEVQQILLATKDSNPFPELLKVLGKVSGASRAYLYEYQRQGDLQGNGKAGRIPRLWAQWCAPGISPRQGDMEPLEACFPAGIDQLEQGHPLNFQPGTLPVAQYLEQLQINALLYVPVQLDGGLWGCLGLDQCGSEYFWETAELELLQSAIAAIVLWSEREHTGFRLRQSEGRLRMIVENAAIAIVTSHPDGTLLDANRAYQNFLGYSAAELRNMHYIDVTYPEDVARDVALTQEMMAGKQDGYQLEKRYIRKDGQVVWGRLNVSAVRDRQGQVQYNLAIIEDISAHKHAEAALQEREILFRLVFQNSAVGIGLIKPDGTVIAYNPACMKLLGYTEEEMYALSFYDYTHPDDLILDLEQYRELLAGRIDAYQMEKRYIRKDKQIIWVRLTVSAIRDAQGHTVLTSGLVEDITEHKQAEAALQERTRLAMLTADVGLALTQGSTLQEILGSCAEALFQHLDVAFARIWTRHEQTGLLELQASAGLYCYLDGNHSRIVSSSTKIGYIATSRQPYMTNDLLQDPRTSDKAWVEREGVVAFAGYPLIVEEQVVGVMAVFAKYPLQPASLEAMGAIAHEIALGIQRKQGEEALRRALEAAEIANRAKSQFLSHMSHELRTPLNVILGFTQLLLRGHVSSQQLTYLDTINRSGEHLLALINDVLEMSKIEAGQLTLNETDFDLYHLLDWLYAMLYLKSSAKGLQLKFERSPNVPPYIRGDRGKLLQILMNLLTNAIKFTSRGQVTLHVEVNGWIGTGADDSTRPPHPITLRFTIEDTGIGIPTEDFPRLFDPFMQSHAGQESQEGTGLGLAISQRFVRLMGGEITVQSQLGKGSVFAFEVAMHAVAAATRELQSLSQWVQGLAPDQPAYRILVAEDKNHNRQFLVELLTSVGFEVQAVTQGEEAIAHWQHWHPHLIWMDIRMPVMDGYEATRQIRGLEAVQGCDRPTTIIALTGSAFEEERQVAIAHGCDDFVRKPVTAAIIFEKLTQYLGVHYTYASPNDIPDNALHVLAPSPTLATTLLTTMPLAWIEQLHQAALQVNAKKIRTLIQEIPADYQDLTQQLTYLIEHFRFEDILKLTQGSHANYSSDH
ncbi:MULTISPECIES: PAS domain S-box protein [unclassified Leptolyngbya]|uniref:PAS domain S-box protein n=1 Tax=unclassified Leptolyngbya TaxID=2650499 RepID=UPI00168820BC|nr:MULTISPECIES: PAS domain S-box protein [unclassified Leptolyngbya]MBD1913368.1 PAS domain S-box protein [Leptolyngbya sp. FACHB-8]MBD2158701.1 PAS domain S-box protein [Leptolyngbya sp. FACHB-16]